VISIILNRDRRVQVPLYIGSGTTLNPYRRLRDGTREKRQGDVSSA
jgi:hypothetical protein